jgi:hypothetical protein
MRLSKPCGAPEAATPKRWEYKHILNRPLTCIVFVPAFFLTFKRYTTQPAPWLKIFL